jgi:DNA-binding transcriptional LysR family regulator
MRKRIAPVPLRWDDIQLFLEIYRERSLTSAAAILRVDQSTMSRRLSALEARMGARLFDRIPGGVEPTPLAEEVLGHAETAEASAIAFGQAVEGADERLRGTVRLAVPDGVDSELVAVQFPRFQARFPGLTLELVASSQVANLARREADVALRMVRPRQNDLIVKKVATLTLGVWVHASLIETHGKRLDRLPWITWDATAGGAEEARYVQSVAPSATIVLRTNRTESRAAAVSAGVGAAVLPDAMASRRSGLVRLSHAPPLPPADVWLASHRGLVNVPRVRAVWEFLEELAGSFAP